MAEGGGAGHRRTQSATQLENRIRDVIVLNMAHGSSMSSLQVFVVGGIDATPKPQNTHHKVMEVVSLHGRARLVYSTD